MKTSAAGRALIIQREGRKLAAYRDSRGIWTIGVGHVDMNPPKVTPGMTITEAECDAMLAADLTPVERVLNSVVTVPMTQNEFDAMVSLGFNIGVGGLRKSTVIKRLNLGDVTGAAEAFMLWSKPSVLIPRREAEKAQFLTPDTPGAGHLSPVRVATARAARLASKASATKDQADAAQVGGAGLVVAGAATVATTHAHHPWLALGLGGGILVAGGIAAAVAIIGNRRAQTLSTNANVQAQRAAALAQSK